MKRYDYLIVGAGSFGVTSVYLAKYASEFGQQPFTVRRTSSRVQIY